MILLQPVRNKPCTDKQREDRRAVLLSSGFLVSIVLLSVVLYVPYLGFYSDDWHFLSLLKNAQDQSFGGLFHSLMTDHNIRVRPVQAAALAVLYQLFGFSPLGYHICNTMLLLAIALLLFALMLELKQSLLLAASLPAVYILLPHYSTDRFWIAALQANISMVFYFASFYCTLRSLRSGWFWVFLSTPSTVISVLSYEVAVPLFALVVIGVLWTGKADLRARWAAGLTSLSVVGCFAFKLAINQRPVMQPGTVWSHALSVVHQALFVNFFQLGLAYPRVVFKIVRYHFDLMALAVAAAIGLLAFLYLQWNIRRESETISQNSWSRGTNETVSNGPSRPRSALGVMTETVSNGPGHSRSALWVIGAGIVIFGLGYAIFLTTDQVAFHKTGVANRTSIAAALGIALCFLGAVEYITARFTFRLRVLCFSLLVSFTCASSALINITLSKYWIRGYEQERRIIERIAAHHLSLPSGTAFIVDGVCPYIGPAPLLESWWENSAVAQLAFRQPDLVGDAISDRIHLNPNSLSTFIYDDEKSYPYGDRFVLYNVPLDRMFVIHSSAEMDRYLRTYSKFSTVNRNCPGKPGAGVAVF